MPNYSSKPPSSTSQTKKRKLLVLNSLKQIIASEVPSIKNAVVVSASTAQDDPNTTVDDSPIPDDDNRPSCLSTSKQ
jgi:hypothetical protein